MVGDKSEALVNLNGPHRALRFALVGLAGVVINSAILWAVVSFTPLPLLIASGIATEAAIIHNFLLNDRWTFRDRAGSASRMIRLARFNSVALGGIVITMGLLVTLTSWVGLPLLAANLLAIGGGTIWNYLVNSWWTWRSSDKKCGQGA